MENHQPMSCKHNTELLVTAAREGNVDEVRRLIPLSDPKADGNFALRLAAEHAHADCVTLLIPVSDPKAHDSEALRRTAQFGHTECVKLLIPVSDPKAHDSAALQWVAYYRHTDCVDLLYPVSDVAVALHHMKQCHPDLDYWHDIEQRWLTEQQQRRLTQELHSVEPATTARSRKM